MFLLSGRATNICAVFAYLTWERDQSNVHFFFAVVIWQFLQFWLNTILTLYYLSLSSINNFKF